MNPSRLSIRQGRVARIDGGGCWVEFAEQRCANCTGQCGRLVGDEQMLWVPVPVPDPRQAFPLDSVVDVGVPRSRLSRIVMLLLGVPPIALIAAGLAHRALDPIASETAVALTGFVAFGVLLLMLARVATKASAGLTPRIVGGPIAVRLLNNDRTLRS